ncbi:MAG: class I SAM-dependent methyltransferase [Anaerolineae bacterium]
MMAIDDWPGPADVAYFEQAQAGAWGEMLRSFLRFAALPAAPAVLDVGTGPGLLPRLAVAAGARLAAGLDASLAMLQRGQALARQEAGLGDAEGAAFSAGALRLPVWACADGLRLPFAAGSFDVVLATNLLFLLPDPATGFAELARVARPGGTVAVLNPTEAMSRAAAQRFADQRGLSGFARFSFVNYGRLAEANRRLSTAAWVALAEAAGLQEIRSETPAGGLVSFVRGTAEGRHTRSPHPTINHL